MRMKLPVYIWSFFRQRVRVTTEKLIERHLYGMLTNSESENRTT